MAIYYYLRYLGKIMTTASFLVKGLSQNQKDFLKMYAQKNLGSNSRTKAILHIINQMMENELKSQKKNNEVSDIQKKAIKQRNLYISEHEKMIKENNRAIALARKQKNHEAAASLSKQKFKVQKKRVQLSLPVYDYDFLLELADTSQSSIQHYISTVLYNHLYNDKKLFGIEIEQLKKSNYELHKIGVNINQIAKANNAGDMRELPINKLHEFIENHVKNVQKILKNSVGIY